MSQWLDSKPARLQIHPHPITCPQNSLNPLSLGQSSSWNLEPPGHTSRAQAATAVQRGGGAGAARQDPTSPSGTPRPCHPQGHPQRTRGSPCVTERCDKEDRGTAGLTQGHLLQQLSPGGGLQGQGGPCLLSGSGRFWLEEWAPEGSEGSGARCAGAEGG